MSKFNAYSKAMMKIKEEEERKLEIMNTIDKCKCGLLKYTFEETCISCAKPATKESSEEIIKPARYNTGKIEVWDFILDQGLGFLEGNVLKYLTRYKQKNGIEDLKKARVYLDKLISEEEKK